jgi:hypothetical protein
MNCKSRVSLVLLSSSGSLGNLWACSITLSLLQLRSGTRDDISCCWSHVDAVRARHVTPVISIYCIVVAEPYFAGSRSA